MSVCRRCAAPLALCLCLAALACAQEAQREGRPVVVVSVLPFQHFVERLAGDLVAVEVMIPPGASPVSYEPAMRQLEAIANASLYVKVGHPSFPFERAWLGRLVADANGLAVVDASEAIEPREGDPHVWVSPRHARRIASHIHAALVALLPDERTPLDANLASLLAEIDAVDAELRDRLGPRRGARFLVFHPAWGYLADDYGLVQLAIEEGHKEPDPRRLAQIIETSRALGIRVVFAQPHFDPRSARMVADELDAEVETLDPLAYEWAANLRHVAERLAAAAR